MSQSNIKTLNCLVLFLSVPLLVFSQPNEIVQLHGSGTTNPSKCYWRIMSQMMQQSKIPVHMSYRAVGSSTGIFEFMGVNNTEIDAYVSFNDFGSGDIPIPTDSHKLLKDNGVTVAHFPFVLGAISLFHSIPGFENGSNGLNLTSCQIAKIFKRDIIYWDDADILVNNENMNVPFKNFPIKVAHRGKGSSSTASFTEYLHLTCPTEWPVDSVGSKIDWAKDTSVCEGSAGMTDCIRGAAGTIGYIDSGHGHSEGLVEIELKNFDGVYLNSKEAGESGIQEAALQLMKEGKFPKSSTDNFGEVKLLNKPGKNTWPMVAMTYVYARIDLGSVIPQADSQSLLKYFLLSLYNPAVIGQCSVYGFTPVPTAVADTAKKGIGMLVVNSEANEWTTETDTDKGKGQGDYVFSGKRKSYSALEASSIMGDVESLKETVAALQLANSKLSVEEEEEQDSKLNLALGFSIFSFASWIILILFFVLKKMGIVG